MIHMKFKVIAGTVLLLAACVVLSVNADDKKDPLAKAKCPISGKAVVKDGVAEHNGGKVYFCCTNCPKAFAKNTAKFAAKANHQMVMTGQFKLAKCPIAGRKLDPSTKISVAGVDVCFCCNNCKGKVAKAEGDEQINLVFSDKAFKKGFVKKK
jgi:YHS domain-containing protein